MPRYYRFVEAVLLFLEASAACRAAGMMRDERGRETIETRRVVHAESQAPPTRAPSLSRGCGEDSEKGQASGRACLPALLGLVARPGLAVGMAWAHSITGPAVEVH
ncbi:hypothetical protein NDU88_006915 [Pleurodeles waltl]|uniref:Secreted protein n=1 Tax=Pleurodeles waltl TaxID=8319 RepID=A0AAV7PMS4_PLEWA|nr:hypothetical protein NDU88_006915 [Pleurodeles waltl]